MNVKNSKNKGIQDAEEYKTAFNLSLRYLSYKDRSEKEIIDYLSKKNYVDSIINKVIDKLKDMEYLNDSKFTKKFVCNIIEQQSKGRNLIKKELIDKGISDEIIAKHLCLYSIGEEITIAKEIAKKYFFSNQISPIRQVKNKLYNRLMRKGFSNDAICKALSYLDCDAEVQSIILQQEEAYEIQAYELTKKYYIKYSKKECDVFKLKQKIYAQLIRRGYDYNLCNRIIEKTIKS